MTVYFLVTTSFSNLRFPYYILDQAHNGDQEKTQPKVWTSQDHTGLQINMPPALERNSIFQACLLFKYSQKHNPEQGSQFFCFAFHTDMQEIHRELSSKKDGKILFKVGALYISRAFLKGV